MVQAFLNKWWDVPSLVKIHWRMLILECSQGCYAVKQIDPVTLTIDLSPWKSKGFQILLRTKYGPSLVKIHWRMLILDRSQGCYVVKFWPAYLDHWPIRLWPWKSIGFGILRTKYRYVPSFVKNPLVFNANSAIFYYVMARTS